MDYREKALVSSKKQLLPTNEGKYKEAFAFYMKAFELSIKYEKNPVTLENVKFNE